MNNNQNPLRLNVGYMYHKPIGTSREVPIEFDQLNIEDILVKDLMSVVQISRTREGLLLQFEVEAKIKTTCVRCLNTFFLPVKTKFEELYQFPSRYREETDLILPSDGFLDLNSLFYEYLILAMPIKRLCKAECKGLCVVCGENLNDTMCEHFQEPEDSSSIIEGEETA